MLSMNGIIACELLLAIVVMGLIFTTFGNTELIADSSSKSNQKPQTDGFRNVTKPGHVFAEISCLMYVSVLAGDYYWAKVTGEAAVRSDK
jgi:hypothetical protein